jgi:ribosomal protein S18 acetylase RimI-like enzyme
MSNGIIIRDAKESDLEAIVTLDLISHREEKPNFWRGIFQRPDRIFLVAELDAKVVGFIVGEVRAWEFGSPPCGWVFALTVATDTREGGIGRKMFAEICQRLKKAGVTTVRTMVDLDSKLTLSFFRGMGMRTGRYIELEKQID